MNGKRAFIKEYFELCEKYGFWIKGIYCCCGGSEVSEIPKHDMDEHSFKKLEYSKQREYIEGQLKDCK
jgi:hypothetical protein